MKKKSIKQQAKYVENKYLEKNKDFYDEIISKNFETHPKKIKRVFIWATPTVAAIVAIILCLVFLWPSSETPPTKKYLLENETPIESEIFEINTSLNGIVFDIDGSYEITTKRIYDSKYNDTLFYRASLVKKQFGEVIELYFYVNPNYDRQKHLIKPPITFDQGDFNGNYNKEISEDDGLYILQYTAEIEFNNVRIYIEYKQLSFDEDGSFFDFIEQTIRKI